MAKATGGYVQQLPSGSFRVSVYAGTDPLTGRQIRLRKTCKTERAAQIELGKLLEQAAAGRQPETNATVAELAAEVTFGGSMEPHRTPPEARYTEAVIRGARAGLGKDPLLIPALGGSLPIAEFGDALGIPCLRHPVRQRR